MKRIYIFLLFISFTNIVFAKIRMIDLSIDSCGDPTQIVSKGSFNYRFNVKNNGKDTLYIGDTIQYQLILNVQYILPNQYTFYNSILTKNILPNETWTITGQSNITFNIANGFKATYCIDAFAINRSKDTIANETSQTIANNSFCKEIQYGLWPLNVESENSNQTFNIWFDHEQHSIHLLNLKNISNNPHLKIFSISGQLLYSDIIYSNFINLPEFDKGIYIYEFIIEKNLYTGKIIY